MNWSTLSEIGNQFISLKFLYCIPSLLSRYRNMDFSPLRRVRNERQYSSLSIYRDVCYISDSIIEIEMLTIPIAFY